MEENEAKNYQLVDPNGMPSEQGKLKHGTCVWLFKEVDGKIFVLAQKRAQKIHNGGFYDVSAGGHIDKGETPLIAALREAKEEIGISLQPSDLEFLCAYRASDKIVHVYISNRTNKNDELLLNHNEVESVEWVELSSLSDFFQTSIKPSLRKEHFHLELLSEALKSKWK